MFDYAIVGTGPTGLTLALYLARNNKKVILIDKESTIGGCHRVRRIDGLFVEHGPRIIIDNYFSLIDILNIIGKKFDELYTPYHFSLNTTFGKGLKVLNYKEIAAIIFEYLKFMINENKSKKISMLEFTNKYNFSAESKDYLDNLCRLVDGGTINNFTLFEFFQVFNQNYFYKIYQPKLPNDVGLLKYWQDALVQTGNVTFLFNTEVKNIISENNKIKHIETNDGTINANNYIFAVPPKPMLEIVRNSTNKDMFGKFNDLSLWVENNSYFVYIPIVFHWNTKLKLNDIWGLTQSDYGIVFIVMSDYMDFQDPRSKTVITCAVKFTDRKSKFNHKTADECSKEELISEVFRQLQLYFGELPMPTYSLLSPGVYKKGNKWDTTDTAYIYTKDGYKSSKSIYHNLYWVGSQNGNSHYSFTSMESAIGNAIALLHELVPETKNQIKIKSGVTVNSIIFIILIFVVILLLI